MIGPSLVLTAWHVVAVGAPGGPQEPAPRIRVVLSDSSEQDVEVPPRFASLCGDEEWTGSAPRADAEVEGRNDVAVLVMRRPAAAHLGHAGLPATAERTASRSVVVLVHYPEGQDRGFGTGRLSKIRNVTARWRHDITTAAGSSGGPCFDRELEMAGLHQGKWQGGGRLVPIGRFLSDLEPLVADDVAPTTLWSLDGSDAALVIGRDLFFQAVAAAGPDSRVRGLRIKRNDPAGPTTGLAFSAEMLGRVLQRRGPEHTVVRVGFDRLVADLVDDVRERVIAAGLPLPEIAPAPAVAPGAAPPEAAARDRAALLAVAVDAAAAQAGRTVWFFFDNPSVALSEAARLALDGFVAAALRRPRLRLVVAGFETVALPGQEFPAPPAAGAGPPGLVVEFLGGFRRSDVVDVLTRAAEDLLGAPANPPVVEAFADVALQGLASFNGLYAAEDLPTVAERVRPALDTWREDGR
nr:trypsin-like peptidase domain-containing protein [Petropleomorpha daqingensis]